jgi:hypothetical protein
MTHWPSRTVFAAYPRTPSTHPSTTPRHRRLAGGVFYALKGMDEGGLGSFSDILYAACPTFFLLNDPVVLNVPAPVSGLRHRHVPEVIPQQQLIDRGGVR